MMEAKDWMSFLIGTVVAAFGALPILHNQFNVGPAFLAFENIPPVGIFAYIVAGLGLYLIINSFIEITNSNPVGWMSFLIAAAFIAVGVLQVLARFGILPSMFALEFIKPLYYQIIFVIEGLFLMIACFAMEM
jgi:hypothetical protein